MGHTEDPTRSDPNADLTRTSAGKESDPTNTHLEDARPEPTELPSIHGYDILGELGRGGIGIVYKAQHIALNRTVAVKLVGGTASVGTLIRFRQEAEAVAKLQHPNIVQVFEVGTCTAGSFLALEYVDGGTLKEKVAGVPQPPREAARMVGTLARAVHHAHDRRLIHRDLKPSNVLLTSSGVPKIADFGLARSLDAGGGVTVTTDFVGTPAYAAPEQISGQVGPVGPATDVYALGVVLYELITGHVPFEAEAIPQILRMVAEEEPVPPHRLKRDCPRDLETICLKCLQKDPRKRYPTAAELADDLRQFVAGEPISARPVGSVERALRWCRRNPAVAGLLVTVFSLLTAVAGVATMAALRIDDARRLADANATKAGEAADHEAEAKRAAERNRDAARIAEREGKEKLLQSLISEAKASRFSRRIGQRFGTLKALRQATALARELGKSPTTFDELRNLAIAALALPDMKPDTAWTSVPTYMDNVWGGPVVDPTYRRAAYVHQNGTISIRPVGTGPNDCDEVAPFRVLAARFRSPGRPTGAFLGANHWHTTIQRLQVWRIEDKGPTLVINARRGADSFVFTPDGRQVVIAEPSPLAKLLKGYVVRMYELETGRAVRICPLPSGARIDMAHHPQRPELAISFSDRVVFIDYISGKITSSLAAALEGSLVWHPLGELLAGRTGAGAEVWDVIGRKRLYTAEHSGGGVTMSFNPTGDLMVTNGWSGRMRLWDLRTGQKLLETTGIGEFRSGDRLSVWFPVANTQKVGPLTRVEAGREYRSLPVGVGRIGISGLNTCSIHPNGRLLAVSTYQGFVLIDLATGTERAFVPGLSCVDVLFEPEGDLLVMTKAGLYRWPIAVTASSLDRLRVGPPELVLASEGGTIGCSSDGRILVASMIGGNQARAWRRDDPRGAISFLHSDCRHAAVSPDGKLVVTGSWSGRGLKVWNLETGKLLRTLLPETSVTIPFFSPDGKWLAESRGLRWRVADWTEGPRPPGGVVNVRFSPDSRLLACAGKGFVALTDAESGHELTRFEDPHQDGFNRMTFSPDGTLLVGVTDDSLCARVWDLRKVRDGLVQLGLDWNAPPYPVGSPLNPGVAPLSIGIVGVNLFFDSVQMQKATWERTLTTLWVNPFDSEARLTLAESFVKQGRPREANAQLTAALAFQPDQIAGYRLRAVARYRLGDTNGCLADADKVLARFPNEKRTRWYRAMALVHLARHKEALPELTASVANYPNDPTLAYWRGEVLRALGRIDEAAAESKRAAKIANPNSPAVTLNNIAWRLVTGPVAIRDPKRALELAQLAINRKPGDGSLLNTLGVARYRNGMPKVGIADLEQSMKLSRGRLDAHNLFPLAMCHAKLAHSATARDCFNRAVKWLSEQKKLPTQWADELRRTSPRSGRGVARWRDRDGTGPTAPSKVTTTASSSRISAVRLRSRSSATPARCRRWCGLRPAPGSSR